MQTKYERTRGPELAGLTLTMIQATMFKVTEDVSCCTDKYMQALEALYFLQDVVQIIITLFESQIILAEHECCTNWGDCKSNKSNQIKSNVGF